MGLGQMTMRRNEGADVKEQRGAGTLRDLGIGFAREQMGLQFGEDGFEKSQEIEKRICDWLFVGGMKRMRVNQVFVAVHTSEVDFLEFDTSLQWKAKLADFMLRKEKVSFRMSYNKSIT
ncbi:hypothetical protein DKX38_015381 [Salix brachista]|uniref:Uncharacterized protein n=1 Tax=Salix brachista TaxID=2182728 RepID=A0A5N5L5Q8_9ROSI|nr:hypothetical protein DKX38_015381 [Salix brachista]